MYENAPFSSFDSFPRTLENDLEEKSEIDADNTKINNIQRSQIIKLER